MKRQNSTFKPKIHVFTLLLLAGLIVGTSMTSAQELQLKPARVASFEREENPSTNVAYNAWRLAVRYRFEEIPDNYDINRDPKMGEIWGLRGDGLRYFLDFIEAINQVQTIMFPPSSSSSAPTQSMTLHEERELIEMVTDRIFFRGLNTQRMQVLSEHDKAYVAELEMILNAIVEDVGDSFFTPEYLQYRAEIIPFVEATGAELFNPSQEAIDRYLEYFGIDDEQPVDLDPNRTPLASCTTTYTIDNWPAKSTIFSGNTGSSWREAKANDQNDCDIFVSYAMNTTPQYGRISANTLCSMRFGQDTTTKGSLGRQLQ
jgi:hypothetical protein